VNEKTGSAFVIVRVIWWIAYRGQRFDPRNHTKQHEKTSVESFERNLHWPLLAEK
jgi:hypothetical protein